MQFKTYVGGSGNLEKAKIVFVGEQPGRLEITKGECFIGPAGQNLNSCLELASIDRNDCYLTNVIKSCDKDLKDYIKLGNGSKGAAISEEGKYFISLLKEELSSSSANLIVPLGNVALFALCARSGIKSWRGSVIESTLLLGRKCLPTIHPATFTQEKLLKTPDEYLNKYLITLDLIKARREAEFAGIKIKDRLTHLSPSFFEVLRYLGKCINQLKNGGTVDYDIELTPHSQELSCISFALNSTSAMCIPFVDSKGDYFTLEEESEIIQLIAQIMENPNWKKRGQNVIFDSHFLLRKYGIITHNLDDTMVAQRILYPEYRIGLNFISSLWTDIPYYKLDGKIWITGDGVYEKGWQYNCLDSLVCAEAFPQQLKELEEKNNQLTYQRQVRLIEPLTFMMEHGIKIDLEGMEKEAQSCVLQMEELQKQLNAIVGFELNPLSWKQVREYFYIQKKMKPFVKNGKVTVDEDALVRIVNKGNKEARLILDIRKLNKRKSTYLDTKKVDLDGRIRCSYNPVGTKFGRISSSGNIFNTGTNLQNVPHDVFSYYIADSGYVVYSLDMSQIENRIVAYYARISQMIEVFEKGLDSHKMTGALIFQKPYEEVSSIAGSSKLGDGKHSERDWAKRSNHAFNYGYGYKSFSIKYEIPEREAKWIYDAYHSAYPGLRNSYWSLVESQLRLNRTLTNLYGRKVSFLGKWSDKLLHEAYSCIPQGTCGDHLNELGINFTYYNPNPSFCAVELLTQIHDSMEFQLPLSLDLHTHAQILLEIKSSLETPLTVGQTKFVVPADLTIKKNLNKHQGIELKGTNFSTSVDDLTARLENALVKLELI